MNLDLTWVSWLWSPNTAVVLASKTPKTLFVLWQELEVGIGGRKSARLFTRVERGHVKCLYCWHKVLMEAVACLVQVDTILLM